MQAHGEACVNALTRALPDEMNHLVEKESLQINMLEHVPTAKPLHTLRDML